MGETVGSISEGGNPPWVFDMLAGTPIMWTTKAAELNRMVLLGFQAIRLDIDAIRAHVAQDTSPPHMPSTWDVSFFLAALAIENLLKGVLVFVHPEYVDNGKFREKIIGSHDLIAIAKDASFSLSDEEEQFCRMGHKAIMSFGRYHVSKDMSGTASVVTIKSSAFMVYEGLYNRLRDFIEKNPFPRTKENK